jgi:hypothetical protein
VVEPPDQTVQIELLRDLKFLGQELSVYVLSTGGWSWVLAWAQLGVASIFCLPQNDGACSELARLHSVAALDTCIVELDWADGIIALQSRPAVVLGHLCWTNAEQSPIAELVALRRHVWLLTTASRGAGATFMKKELGMRTAELRHRQLGGLTSARVMAGWTGPKAKAAEIQPGQQRNPTRPLGTFLEPSVRLLQWRAVGSSELCWRPNASDAAPYPWPWPPTPLWVEVPSVFAVKGVVERPLMAKELCQLADLRKDWGVGWIDAMWGWDGGKSPPLRLLVEFSLAALPWLRLVANIGSQDVKEASMNKIFDWGRVRARGWGLAKHRISTKRNSTVRVGRMTRKRI